MKLLPTLLTALFIFTAPSLTAADVSLKSIEKDLNFLAHDNLKGRASFSEEADRAADYIVQRFKDIGLQPYRGTFRHRFPVFVSQISNASMYLNKQSISDQHFAIASTAQQLNWLSNNQQIQRHVVKKDEDLRSKVNQLNQQGGQHVVAVHPSHQELFNRYKQYFSQPRTRLSNEEQGSLVLVLTELDELEHFRITAQNHRQQKQLTNVSGLLPGRSKDYEVVLFSAHYDHIGSLTETTPNYHEQQDKIFNGADDNASGTTAVINLAQHFKTKNDNERSLMFVAFAAEELGGYGSQYFSQQLPANNIVAMINMEMIGKPSKFGHGKVWMTGFERSDLGNIMNTALEPHQNEIHPDPYPKQNLFYRSDNATLARLGVPAHSFSSTQLDKDPHYHKVTDEVETLDTQSMKKVIDTIARAVEPIVAAEATPSRIDVEHVTPTGKIF